MQIGCAVKKTVGCIMRTLHTFALFLFVVLLSGCSDLHDDRLSLGEMIAPGARNDSKPIEPENCEIIPDQAEGDEYRVVKAYRETKNHSLSGLYQVILSATGADPRSLTVRSIGERKPREGESGVVQEASCGQGIFKTHMDVFVPS